MTLVVEDTSDAEAVSVDVHLSPEQWAAIVSDARAQYELDPGTEPAAAFWDAVHTHVEVVPNIVVEGETKGVEDVPGLEVRR